MALPVMAKYAPIMIMFVRLIPLSGSSTTPYACASVSASGMIIIKAPNATARAIESTLRTDAASPDDRLKASCERRCTATMTTDITMTAAHANAAAGLAFQLATASPIAMRGKAEPIRDETQLSAMSGFSFDGPPRHLVLIDASPPIRFQIPPEGLGKAEQRLLQDRHHEPVDDRPSGFLRFDEPRLLQHGEMGRHGRLRHREVIGQFTR